MEIRLRLNGQTMLEDEFRAYQKANGGPTWGLTTTEILNELDSDVVFDGPYPTATEYQVVSRDGAEQIDGQWYTKHKVTDMDQEAIDAVNAQKTEANKKKAAKLLSESDFYDLPNTANKISNISEILAYRDALRAIALNPTFDATFPTKPATVWL
jgi:hypothetical protein